MKVADLVGGGMGIALGAYVLYEGVQMPADHIMKIGPSFFPDLLATGLIVFSSLLVIYALLGRAKGAAEPLRLRDKGVQRTLLALFAVILYATAFIPLGYPLATFLLVGVVMVILGRRQPLELAVVSLATTVAVWVVFAKLLKLSMPLGVLENLLDGVI